MSQDLSSKNEAWILSAWIFRIILTLELQDITHSLRHKGPAIERSTTPGREPLVKLDQRLELFLRLYGSWPKSSDQVHCFPRVQVFLPHEVGRQHLEISIYDYESPCLKSYPGLFVSRTRWFDGYAYIYWRIVSRARTDRKWKEEQGHQMENFIWMNQRNIYEVLCVFQWEIYELEETRNGCLNVPEARDTTWLLNFVESHQRRREHITGAPKQIQDGRQGKARTISESRAPIRKTIV